MQQIFVVVNQLTSTCQDDKVAGGLGKLLARVIFCQKNNFEYCLHALPYREVTNMGKSGASSNRDLIHDKLQNIFKYYLNFWIQKLDKHKFL